MPSLLQEFENYPKEKLLIGSLLIAYGEIEFGLLSCLNSVLEGDTNTSARILFRIRGESARIEVADAILRQKFSLQGLGGQWGNALGAVRHCKTIRNQYAHCHWHSATNGLFFMNFDSDVQMADGDVQISFRHIHETLLQEQTKYFEFATDWLFYLAEEYKTRAEKLPNHGMSAPKSISAPQLYSQIAPVHAE